MARPVTLFTGQWADLPLAELAPLAKRMGYDGLELACWGDHFDVQEALASSRYVAGQAGAAARARPAVPRDRQPPGRPGRVRPDRRAPPGDPARACVGRRRARGRAPARRAELAGHRARGGAASASKTVTGFTGSSIWHATYAFPPTTQAYWDAGFADFGRRFGPILDVFEQNDINFALEVHPTEIAFDIASAERAIEAVDGHRALRLQLRPEPPRLPGRRLRALHPHASPTASSTPT